MSLPPLNFTPHETAAVAVALSLSENVLFTRDARSALRKIAAAMPERALQEARTTAEKVRLLVKPGADPDAGIAETIWRAVRENHVVRIRYIDVGGVETEREVEPQHVVIGPNGSYLTAWCHLRGDERVSRMDRLTWAEPTPSLSLRPPAAAGPSAEGHETKLPASVRRPEELLPNTDIELSRGVEKVDAIRHRGRMIRRRRRHRDQPCSGTLAWFEIATSDPDRAEKFYGSLFDWTFDADNPTSSGGMDYRNVKASGADRPMGGLVGISDQVPGHAVFYILVADVEATCVDAEQLGGSV